MNPEPAQAGTAAPRPPEHGVIHDIGYRHYDGNRLGRAGVLRALFVQSLRSAYGLGRTARSKVLPFILLGVMLLPALILEIVLIVGRSQPEMADQMFSDQLVPYPRYAIILQAAIAIFLAIQAPTIFSRDLRFRTVSLYFSRPLTRLDYVAAKYLALVAALVILMAAPLLVMYLGGLLAKLPAADQTGDFALGLVSVVLFALVFAGLGGLIASLTARRGFGVAAIITVLTISYATVTMLTGLAESFGNPALAGYLGVFSPVTLVDGVQYLVLDAPHSGVEPPPAGVLGAAAYLLAYILTVAGSFGLLLLRYRKVAGA